MTQNKRRFDLLSAASSTLPIADVAKINRHTLGVQLDCGLEVPHPLNLIGLLS